MGNALGGVRQQEISVILPLYNGAPYLSDCLNSIASQTRPPFEVIVVDDGSTDDGKGIVDQFNSVRYFRIDHGGVAAARNFGLTQATGNWIAFIDQDDFWTPESLESRMSFGISSKIIIGKQQWFLDGLESLPPWVKKHQVDDVLDGYLLGCALIHRDLFEQFSVFDTSLRFCSDFDWFFRLKDAGVIFYQVDKIVLHKRIHSMNESRHADLSLKELSIALHRSIQRKRTASVANLTGR
jgi:glycosyltransferase involved in cell wall biosynthesis